VGERWRSMWLNRLESNVPQIVSSLQHQNGDAGRAGP
jgi:hypothetical protein